MNRGVKSQILVCVEMKRKTLREQVIKRDSPKTMGHSNSDRPTVIKNDHVLVSVVKGKKTTTKKLFFQCGSNDIICLFIICEIYPREKKKIIIIITRIRNNAIKGNTIKK